MCGNGQVNIDITYLLSNGYGLFLRAKKEGDELAVRIKK
jgi:hypothetical protein